MMAQVFKTLPVQNQYIYYYFLKNFYFYAQLLFLPSRHCCDFYLTMLIYGFYQISSIPYLHILFVCFVCDVINLLVHPFHLRTLLFTCFVNALFKSVTRPTAKLLCALTFALFRKDEQASGSRLMTCHVVVIILVVSESASPKTAEVSRCSAIKCLLVLLQNAKEKIPPLHRL